jgi:hypothetical protein
MPSAFSGQALTHAFPMHTMRLLADYLGDKRKQNEIIKEQKGIIG